MKSNSSIRLGSEMNLRKREGISARKKMHWKLSKKILISMNPIIKTVNVWKENYCLWIDLQLPFLYGQIQGRFCQVGGWSSLRNLAERSGYSHNQSFMEYFLYRHSARKSVTNSTGIKCKFSNKWPKNEKKLIYAIKFHKKNKNS